jgi:hypothetical protein
MCGLQSAFDLLIPRRSARSNFASPQGERAVVSVRRRWLELSKDIVIIS